MMKNKTLADWLYYYETLHSVGIDMGLDRVALVWKALCKTHSIKELAKQKVITVAGTNGKGSACQMLSMLLMDQGCRVGMYTSPHIHQFNERIKLNDTEVDDKVIIRAFESIELARGKITLSYFEATTLAGLLVFAWQEVDYAVLEVGLGGRLDAINVIDADAALITSIGLDHEAFLGNDLPTIAMEKMGVCRSLKPAVYAQPNIFPEAINYAKEHSINLLSRDNDYFIKDNSVIIDGAGYELPDNLIQLGKHQLDNAAGVVVLLHALSLLPCDYTEMLSKFFVSGRLQKISNSPDVIVDVAHNEAAAEALADYVRRHKPQYQNIIAVIGMLKDKEHEAILNKFSHIFSVVYCGSTWGERSFSDMELSTCVKKVLDVPVFASGDLPQAYLEAKKVANDDDLIIAFGSFLVAEALIKQ